MSEKVGAFSLVVPTESDSPDVPRDIKALVEDLSAKLLGYSQGTTAARPAAGVVNRIYKATDTDIIYHDTGTEWELLSYGGLVSSTTTAPVGGEFIELPGAKTINLPDPTKNINKRIGAVNGGVSGELTLSTAVGEIWTFGKTLNLFTGETVILRSNGAIWIVESIRLRSHVLQNATAMSVNANHLCSATRTVKVLLSVTSPKQAPTIEAKLLLGGVQQLRVAMVAEEAQRYFTMSFDCPPGVEWQLATAGAWTCEAAYIYQGDS